MVFWTPLQVQQQLAAAQGEASQVPGLQQRAQSLQRQLSEATSAAYAAEAQASKANQQAAQLQQQAAQAQQVGDSRDAGNNPSSTTLPISCPDMPRAFQP
jgi:hypothetical protein